MAAAYIPADAPHKLIALVTPITDDPATSGKIKHVPCSPTIKHKWLAPYVTDSGTLDYTVEGRFARKGYILLRDLFEAEGDHAGWAEYEKHLADCSAGRARKPFPADKLPLEVRRRRACGADPDASQREARG